MTEREAFEKEYPRIEQVGVVTNVYGTPEEHEYAWGAWQVACKWQRERDAEICKTEEQRLTNEREFDYAVGADVCADAILNQGDK